jgi:hypothetical protein
MVEFHIVRPDRHGRGQDGIRRTANPGGQSRGLVTGMRDVADRDAVLRILGGKSRLRTTTRLSPRDAPDGRLKATAIADLAAFG